MVYLNYIGRKLQAHPAARTAGAALARGSAGKGTEERKMNYYAGIDLGGTFVKCGIIDEVGNILIKDKIPTGAGRPYAEIAADMARLVTDLAERAGISPADIKAAGVGSPGIADSKNGVIVYSCNLNWDKVPLSKEMQKHLGVPVFVTNDANAAALGESFAGAAKNYPSSIFITLGTGVGGGIILDGVLFEGNRSAGAEIGHMVIRAGGEKCACGRRGCFEAYASATALIRQTKRAMDKDRASQLWKICPNLEDVDGKTAFDGLRAGDKTAEKVVKNYISYLAEGIANLANIFRPNAVVLGGGVCAEGDTLLVPLRRKVNRLLYGGTKYAPVVLTVATLGNDAGLVGAARFAMQNC